MPCQGCEAGMTFTVASDKNLRELRGAVQPVYNELNADPGTKASIDAIQALKAALGARPDTARCSGQPVATTGSSSTAIPNGTYRMTLLGKDWGSCSVKPNPDVVQELELRNGEVRQYAQPLGATGAPAGPREIGWVGSYRVFRDRFELTESNVGHTMSTLWTFDGKKLTLSDMQNGRCDDITVWTTHPWVLK